jgi:Ca-activated chloride channel family protein
MKSNTLIKVGVLAGLAIIFVVASVKLFGTTVSSKFSHAQRSVESEVTFGGSSLGYERAPARAARYNPKVEADFAPDARPATDANQDRLSTFALDVDTAAYTHARATIEAGGVPYASHVRVEEFVNYFDYDHRAPRAGTPFAVSMETAPSPMRHGLQHQLMRVKLDARKVSNNDRKPAHLTFLIDTSGSMAAPNKLPLTKDALKYLVSQLDGRDTIAIATYAGSSELVLPPTKATRVDTIYAALDGLVASGGTAMSDGMQLAYRAALRGYQRGHVNRVVVVSDGDANIGATSHEEILQGIRSGVEDGIRMTTIGVGMGNYRADNMEQLADNGDGNAFYVGDMREAKRIFGDELTGTLEVVAQDAKVQVEFDPALVKSYRLLGYENRAIADHDFRNDSVDAGEIGAGHQVTALYEVELHEPVARPFAVAHIRWAEPGEFTAREGHYTMKRSDLVDDLREASADHQFAVGLALFAEKMQSPDSVSAAWDFIEDLVRAGTAGNRTERREVLGLIRSVASRT